VTGPRTIVIGDLTVRVHVQGDGDPLLLLNGLTRPLESWEPFTRALGGRLVISFDSPGVGLSPAPRLPISMPRLAELAAGVLTGAGVQSADVLGFSHGGAIAQQMAAAFPRRVRRLVLVATSCGVGAELGGRTTLRGVAPGGTAVWPRPDLMGVLWHALAITSWSSIPFLGSIAAPTLVVSGARDQVVPPGNGRLLARRIPGAELVLLPAGHDLQRVGPARLLAGAVDDFLHAQDERMQDSA
jgi:poly(3-hydroxyoctanoate) depolymerase